MSAADHKEKAPQGNAAFKAGDYPNAIGHYTSAILADASDPTFPLNRAAAYLKLGKNEDAERDCTTVLKLQSTNVKALFRRAQARVAIGKLSDARADLVAAAKAEPGNAAVRAEFQKVEELIAAAAKKAKAGKGTPIAVPTRPQPSGTPYRRRVPISIVDDDATKEDKGKGKEPATPLKSILKGTSSLSISEPSSPPKPKSRDLLTAVSTRTTSSTNAEAPVTKSPTPTPSPAPVTTAPNPVSPPPTEPTPQKSAPSTSQVTPPSSAQAVTPPASQDATPPAALPPHPDATPPTLATFLQKWSNARTDADRAAIFFAIPPDSIASLFGPTLESPLLGSILGALSSVPSDERQRTVEYLVALSRVPRFSTLVLFLDGSEKTCVRGVWDVIQAGDVNGVDVAQEMKKWGC